MSQPLLVRLVLVLATALGAPAALAEARWIDVRSTWEHKLDSIPGDPNVPHDEIADAIGTLVPDKSSEIVLYCRSGGRADVAQQTLERLGYTNVRNAGGIDEARKERAPAS